MIEAMACGTPVLAFDWGSVREVIDDGVTGRVVTAFEEAVAALPQVLKLDRRKVRRRLERRFSAKRMANNYVRVYQSLLAQPPVEQLLRTVDRNVIRLESSGSLTDAALYAAE